MIKHGISTLPQRNDIVDFALASTLANGKKWFEDCRTAHAECKIRSRFVPTRLLDVAPLEESEDGLTKCLDVASREASKDVKLIDTKRCGIRSDANLEYATLSHCWGRSEHITTKSDTRKEFEAGITFSQLNRTFQDAVLVTRALGLRYLWIDSLCIIQDSVADWQRESFLMGSIYNGGTINIVADAAEDGDQGFLSKRTLSSLPYTLPGENSQGMLFMEPAKRERWIEYSGNLRRRAWVLQEYTLSACSVRYNMNGLVWECRGGCHYDSEVLFEENQARRAVRDLKNVPLQIGSVSPSSPASKISEIMAVWRKIVSEYSKKELTYETDVLPALSGLASLIHTATGDRYLAGIWRSDLPEALRWVPESPDWRSSTYLAPTWSWACCKKSCPVTYLSSIHVEYRVKVLDAGVTLVGENPFGSVSDGFLKLEGLALRGAFEQQQQEELKPSSSKSPSFLQVVFELKNEKRVRVSTGVLKNYSSIQNATQLPPVWGLLICFRPREDLYIQKQDLGMYGVLVIEEDLHVKNVFRRLAYQSCLMTEADWDQAEKKIVIIK